MTDGPITDEDPELLRATSRAVQYGVIEIARWASRKTTLDRLRPLVPDLVLTDLWLLLALDEHGAMRPGELAARQHVDRSTVTPQVRRLLHAGYAVRRPAPGDRRAALIDLTDKGRGVVDRAHLLADHAFALATADWTAEDRAAFGDLLGRFTRAIATLDALPIAAQETGGAGTD
ncbi:MarR family transcriptional regulator [Raineyella sp.]|uniref:MarR family winged helix-turn-helix transcriptional regulator n=1 Tax=Raineyella sp. TaxID=1911550 RepID=UPI002B1F7E20|nr:MarR family transcriptional regulator [Raineyella sp.]MEA5155879.1 MarR family transcriptional regulator [Raineyella sp.]